MATVYDNQGRPIPKNTRGLNDGKMTVYDVKTGKPDKCFPIDAKDRVSTGGWAYEKPEKKRAPKKTKDE